MMERFAGRHWFDRIDETVVLGALPLRSVTDEVPTFIPFRLFLKICMHCYFIRYLCDAQIPWKMILL